MGDTLRRVWEADYPEELLEMVVVCEESDRGTTEDAEEVVRWCGCSTTHICGGRQKLTKI